MIPWRRVPAVLREEVAQTRPRLVLARLLTSFLPLPAGGRLRAIALRLAGCRIGKGVVLASMPRIIGDGDVCPRLTVGDHCYFNVGVTLELGEPISIGCWVTLGPETMLLTTTHEIGDPDHRCSTPQRSPIRVGDGAWIGARVLVLPGVTIGAGAVVGAGSLVIADVEPNTLVAGVPAQAKRLLPVDHGVGARSAACD